MGCCDGCWTRIPDVSMLLNRLLSSSLIGWNCQTIWLFKNFVRLLSQKQKNLIWNVRKHSVGPSLFVQQVLNDCSFRNTIAPPFSRDMQSYLSWYVPSSVAFPQLETRQVPPVRFLLGPADQVPLPPHSGVSGQEEARRRWTTERRKANCCSLKTPRSSSFLGGTYTQKVQLPWKNFLPVNKAKNYSKPACFQQIQRFLTGRNTPGWNIRLKLETTQKNNSFCEAKNTECIESFSPWSRATLQHERENHTPTAKIYLQSSFSATAHKRPYWSARCGNCPDFSGEGSNQEEKLFLIKCLVVY